MDVVVERREKRLVIIVCSSCDIIDIVGSFTSVNDGTRTELHFMSYLALEDLARASVASTTCWRAAGKLFWLADLGLGEIGVAVPTEWDDRTFAADRWRAREAREVIRRRKDAEAFAAAAARAARARDLGAASGRGHDGDACRRASARP